MPEINIKKNTLTVDTNSLVGKLIAGCTGKITVKSPYFKGGQRVITSVRDINDPVEKPKAVKSEKKSK